MTRKGIPTSWEAQLAAQIERKVQERLTSQFVIPVLQDDPPETLPINLWMRTDGRLRGRVLNAAGTSYVYYHYALLADIAGAPTPAPAPVPPPAAPTPRTYKTTWAATWSQTYRGDNAKRTDERGENYLVYGYEDSATGNNEALIGFDYANIVATLTGSTVKSVQLSMTNVSAYWPTGVDVFFGIHNSTSEPATWPSIVRPRVKMQRFGAPETKTVSLPLEFATRIRDGSGKGIAIQAPNSSRDYYGYAAGVGSGYTPPQLIVTYAK